MSQTLQKVTKDVYKAAALDPQKGLCCTTSPVWKLPELEIPAKMPLQKRCAYDTRFF